ncbi:MAG: ABC transporter permease subunit, partial [Alphaproteobacteria bacterium]
MTAMRRAADLLAILIVLLLLWQGLHQVVGATALPAPVPTLSYLVRFVMTARFAENAIATATAFAFALLLAYGLGLAIGVWMGAHRLSGAVGEPILVALYSLPKITLYPVILLIFGLGLSGKTAFGALHGILPVALLTMAAIRNISPVYLKAARSMNLSSRQTILMVLFPATLPEIVSGLRIGLTV